MKKEFARGELGKAFRFAVVGVLNTGVDYGIFWLLARWLLLNPYLSQVISYSCGVLNSYVLNRKWTFGTKQRFFSRQLVQFLLVNLITLGLSVAALWVLSDVLILPLMLAKLLTVGVTMAAGFILNRLWVFGKTEA